MALINCKECGVQVSTQAKACPNCGAKVKKPTSIFTWIILVIVVFGIFAAIGGGDKSGGTSSGSSEVQLSPKEQALNDVQFDFSWSKDGFGNIMMIDMTVKNNGIHDIKDFTVECEHTSNSGTKIDSNKREVFEIIKAGETKKFKQFNMGFIHSQAASSSCGITDLVVI
ncbi:hypothetical protein F892_01714 [Acinetobacter vivianii]|uniref:Zinc-ribbon domain-containing protein n=1 Tax=Acinetobacter vivianii TaxID=1776742 RepID=N9Q689_9GAMM|nr:MULTISPECIES: zinc ribbon domain-containing protein [Acinetobacter]ENX22472.1 hypothetical protein F892_01714 [Acinetobacter vivianii]KYQ82956.1 hypothetical protein AWW72_16360 [Acinetobacter sp. NRRL B-65365]GGI58841.1 hypothetical protein GCM10011446_03360 [Acinetobacter vivianii]